MEHSALLKVVRGLAGQAAHLLGYSQVEAEHLMLSLCKVEDRQVRAFVRQLKLGQDGQDRAEAEIATLLRIFSEIGLDPVRLRRSLRTRLKRARVEAAADRPRLPLAALTQTLLDSASQMAQLDGSPAISTVHLLAAIGNTPGAIITELMRAQQVRPDILGRYVGSRARETAISQMGAISYRALAAEPSFIPMITAEASDRARWLDRLHSMYAICQAIIAAEVEADFFAVIMREVQAALPTAQHGAILTLDTEDVLTEQASWPEKPIALSTSWAKRATRKQEAFVWSALEPSSKSTPASIHGSDVQSAIYAPLIHTGQPLGLLYLGNCDRDDAFDQADLDLVRAVAAQAAIAVHNRELLRDRERLRVLQANLRRHLPPVLVTQLIAAFSKPGAAPVWNSYRAVLAVELCPPPNVPPGERLQWYHDLSIALAESLQQAGAAISRSTRGEPLVAVFHPLQPGEDGSILALSSGWFLLNQPLPEGWTLGVGLDIGEVAQCILASNPTPSDEFSRYEIGLRRVRERIKPRNPGYDNLLIYEQRLIESLSSTRLYGDTAERKAERSSILFQLNRLVSEQLNCAFLDLCPRPFAVEPAPVAAEYCVAGVAVDAAVALAHRAAGSLLISPAARSALGACCSVEPIPDLGAFAVYALAEDP